MACLFHSPFPVGPSSRNATRQASAGIVSATDPRIALRALEVVDDDQDCLGRSGGERALRLLGAGAVGPARGACFVCRHSRPDSSGKSFARSLEPEFDQQIDCGEFSAHGVFFDFSRCSSLGGAGGERLPAWRRRRHLRVAFRSSQRASCHLRRGLSSWPGRGDARRKSYRVRRVVRFSQNGLQPELLVADPLCRFGPFVFVVAVPVVVEP